MLPFLITKIVCYQCWELVQTFHEFYVRVQNAHIAATNTLKSLQETEIPVTEIKIEPDAVDELASPPKRRRGRPRRQKVDKKSEESVPIGFKQCTVGIEPLLLPFNSSNSEETKDLDFENFEIKSEVMPSEFMDATDCIQQSDVANETKSVVPDSSAQNNDESLLVPKKKIVCKKRGPKLKRRDSKAEVKRDYNKLRHKTSDYDDYIAQNFKLTCFLCQKSLENFTVLKTHYRAEHKTNGYVKCCGKKLLKRGVLVDHLHLHNDPEYFKCQHCGKLMTDRRGHEKHVQFFHGSRERIYQCDICSKSFFRREVLARHYQIHASEEDKRVKCTQCEKTFGSEYHMKQHLNLYHLRLYAKICDICGKSFTGGEAFRRHQQEHAGLPKSKVKCEICNTELSTKNGLTQHIKTMHTEEYQKPQVCSICSKISPSLRSHITHLRNVHATKMHDCKICDKTFNKPIDLREHMATHTGEALYTCTFCPKTFQSHSNMYKHRKQKHPQEWSEKCLKKNIAKEMVNKIVGLQYSKDPDPTRTGCAGFPGHD